MKRIFYFLIAAAICLAGCNNPNDEPINHFTVSKSIKAFKVVDLQGFDILYPLQVESYKNWYVFHDRNYDGGCVKLLSKDLKTNVGCLKIGNGPFELTEAYSIFSIDDSLFVTDDNHRKLINICYDDSLRLSYASENSMVGTMSVPISIDRFINVENFKEKAFLTLEDKESHVFSRIDNIIDEGISALDDFLKMQMLMNAIVLVSPDKKKFAWGHAFFPSYGFGRIIGDSLAVDTEFEYRKAEFVISGPKDIVTECNSLKNVYSGFGTDDYAVFLYNGKPYEEYDPSCKTLLLYTWDGEPYMKVDIDKNLQYIRYDKERNVMFGIGNNPEPVLVEYDMTGIL